MDAQCLFCKIIAKQIPSTWVYEDDRVIAFRDVHPQAPTHVLIIPREHFTGLDVATEAHEAVLGHALLVAARIARELGVGTDGYRVVINNGAHAGQSVFHLHVHLLAGRAMAWPPG